MEQQVKFIAYAASYKITSRRLQPSFVGEGELSLQTFECPSRRTWQLNRDYCVAAHADGSVVWREVHPRAADVKDRGGDGEARSEVSARVLFLLTDGFEVDMHE